MIGLQANSIKIFLVAILYIVLANSAILIAADAKAPILPHKIIDQATENLLQVIERDREKIKKSPNYVYEVIEKYLVPHIDFISAGRWVLGKYERSASKKEKIQFILEFRSLMVRFYATALREYLIYSETKISKDMMKIFPVKLKDGQKEVTVRSQILPSSGKKIPIHFHMRFKKGKWKIFDVSVEGVSVITTYRTSFSSQIRKKGLAAVIVSLKQRNASLDEAVKLNKK